MENEIVGDLHAAFSNVPDRAEEKELHELFPILNSGPLTSAQFHKACTGLPSRMFSQQMPGGFGVSSARRHLEEQWGLGPGRQDSVFLRACTVPIATRLPTEVEAKAFFDTVAHEYIRECGLEQRPASTASPSPPIAANAITPAVVDSAPAPATAAQSSDDLFAMHERGEGLRAATRTLQDELDDVAAELGTDFLRGIKSQWSKDKVRRYDSSWNWGLEDLYKVYYGVLRGELAPSDPDVRGRCALIVKKSNRRLLQVMQQLKESVPTSSTHAGEASEMLLLLIRDSEQEQSSLQGLTPSTFFDPEIPVEPRTEITSTGRVKYSEVPRTTAFDGAHSDEVKIKALPGAAPGWSTSHALTEIYRGTLTRVETRGIRLQEEKTILLIGTGRGSIGRELLRRLLAGGARVVVTTSKYLPETCREYQRLYMRFGARGSELVLVPFNQGSIRDVDALTHYIFDPAQGLGWDLDYVIPFAAVPEQGEITRLGPKSELAHRIMLTNTLRLLGSINEQKSRLSSSHGQVTQVILPLSPNHGAFGSDGLYAESKIGLEVLVNKWSSESWSSQLLVAGATIGWVRGTGLMSGNDRFAMGLEHRGLRTYTTAEMANRILAVMDPALVAHNEHQPLIFDLCGGMAAFPDLKQAVLDIRRALDEAAETVAILARERKVETEGKPSDDDEMDELQPLANLEIPFPRLPEPEGDTAPLPDLQGMLDLDHVVVVAGFAEVGPCGNARTRWELETEGELSLEGHVEMAWIMGLIKHHSGPLDGQQQQYVGWVDVKTNKPIEDSEVEKIYGSYMRRNMGIRLTMPELVAANKDATRQVLHEIVLEADMPPFLASADQAEQFKAEYGDFVDMAPSPGNNQEWLVRLRKGAALMVPKAVKSKKMAIGQLPTGWDADTYGVPDWIIQQVDRNTLHSIVCAVEALLSAGIVDPFEIYKHIHISEVGNCLGSGVGGMESLRDVFRSRYLDKPVQKDALQETFINTTAAWINMLLLSATGPIRTPVGACATSVESLESGYECILSGRAKLVLVGGCDDICDEISYEFGCMNATVNCDKELAKGREPSEMCRPMSSSRSGFVESQGAGMQILSTARLAIEMGLPIHAIVAWAGTSSDKIGRSVPAPGKGALVNAREAAVSQGGPVPLLDLHFRREQLTLRRVRIQEQLGKDLHQLAENSLSGKREQEANYLRTEARHHEKDATVFFGHSFWIRNPHISPLRGAWAVWGLTVDDIDFASLHGTSTVLNDLNETSILQKQLTFLGRGRNRPLFAVAQKNLTGHSKGAAGAWMLNGCCQALDSGIIPGNRNADNIAAELEQNDLMVFPHDSVQTTGLRACSVTSFGFGQKGGQAILVHPRYLFAAIARTDKDTYQTKRAARQREASKFLQQGLARNALFIAKEKPPYSQADESDVLLDPNARAVSGMITSRKGA